MNGLRTLPAGLHEALDDFRSELFTTLNCVSHGTIQSLNAAAGSVTVALNYKRVLPDGTTKTYPTLVDCPVFTLQGGGAFIEFPIKEGDFCLVLFSDRDIDTWWTSENIAPPNTSRRHDLSDGFALVGVNSKLHPVGLSGNVRINGMTHLIDFVNNQQKWSALLAELVNDIMNITTYGDPGNHTVSQLSKTALNNTLTKFQQLFGGS